MGNLQKNAPFIIALLFFLIPVHFHAQGKTERDKSKERLMVLLKERSNKFDRYTESISQRSGIFGNQTKKDLRRVNEVLMEITQTDNVIFKELKRLLDYKDFEKGSVIHDFGEYQVEKNRYVAAIDTLNKQIIVLNDEKNEYRQQSTINRFLNIILGSGLIFLFFVFRRKRKKEIISSH
jgi:hypothetical protein